MFIRYFLKASAWQLCLMMVAPYIVYKFTTFGHNPVDWGFLVVYFLVVTLGWIYSVGISANDKLGQEFKKSPLLFRVAILVPFIYVPIFVSLFLIPLASGEIHRPPQFLIFIHFLSLFAAAYSIWFTSKQLTTLQNNEETSFVDYYPALMGFWFGVIGVWFLQPKASEIFFPKQD